MTEHKLVPKIRFQGFSEEWEESILGKIGNVKMNKRIYKKQTTAHGEVPFYKIGTFGKKADSFITQNLYDEYRKKYDYPKIGDILISASGTIGNKIIYNGQKAYYQDSNIVWLNINKNILSNSFLYYFYDIVHWKGIEGSTIKRLYNSSILNTKIKFPTINEQQKIGKLFFKIDQLIKLQQQKVDKLELLKKAFLQKMFASEKQKVPEIRFTGFNDEWEERSLSKISNKISEKNKRLQYHETFTNSAEYGIVSQKDFFDKNITNIEKISNYYIVKPNYFVYNPRISKNAPVGPINKNNLNRTGIISPLYYVFKVHDIDYDFLEYFFSSSKWHKFMKLNGDSGARSDRFAIKNSVLSKMPIPFTDINEQQKIGAFFEKLDQLISANNHKLTNLKLLKKSLLQNMFI